MTESTLPATLAPCILRAIEAQGYTSLTEVQSQVITEEADGRDLIVSAQTGSGKTVAFGLAMAKDLLDGGDMLPHARDPLALIIAPTRELALQVSRELTWLYAQAGARIVTCVGAWTPSRNAASSTWAPISLWCRAVCATIWNAARSTCRSEGHRSGRSGRNARHGLPRGSGTDLEATPESRRTLLFSATMPGQIVAGRRYQRDALRISTVGENRGHGDIAYQVCTVAPADIEHAVVNLLRFHEADTAILFCATRDNVRHLHATLVERGLPPSPCRVSIVRTSATTRFRLCATAAPAFAWPPTLPRAVSTFPT
jgi:ATP-dependent RNA helicase DeaD